MKITGEIEVIDITNNKLVSSCKNTFTNIGKQHVCDWLLHDNFSKDENESLEADGSDFNLSGGRSMSIFKIVKPSEITGYYASSNMTGGGNELYSGNESTSYLYFHNQGNVGNLDSEDFDFDSATVYYEFTSPKDLYGLMIWGRNGYSYDRDFKLEIATSPNDYATNSDWTRQLIYHVPDTGSDDAYDFITFDDYNSSKIIEDVKTVRLRTWYYTSGNICYYYMYGLWFLEENFYPCTPSVIALGDDNTSPLATDISLGNETYRRFVDRHVSSEDDNKVIYSIRIPSNAVNGNVFKEIGLFFNTNKFISIGEKNGSDVCDGLFAHGVFDNPWTKESGIIYDVNYKITISEV